jgi:broad specificity phosphatase PhoE
MIYLVRHGEAASSWGEHPNPGLSPKGHIQAETVAAKLPSGISNAISSPMQRCIETSAPFAKLSNLSVPIEPFVTEIPTPSDTQDRVTWLRALMAGQWDSTPQLVKDWRENLIKTVSALPPQTVVFSHFIAINALVGHLEGRQDVTVFKPDHCSVTTLGQGANGLTLIKRGNEAGTKVL